MLVNGNLHAVNGNSGAMIKKQQLAVFLLSVHCKTASLHRNKKFKLKYAVKIHAMAMLPAEKAKVWTNIVVERI